MQLEDYFPIWSQLSVKQQNILKQSAVKREVSKGVILRNYSSDCIGFIVVCTGQLRAFMLSKGGKEITLYRLFERDICLFSASCMIQNIQFNLTIEAEKDSVLWIVPSDIYKNLMESSLEVANYTNNIMGARFSEVMWLMEQIMWKSFDKRLAAFLLEECVLESSDTLKITHERIANHLGTAREVVTRMLRYFQSENMVHLLRGQIQLTNIKRLQGLAE